MNDEGTITIAAAGIAAALLSLLGAAAFAASIVIATHRSQVASDMSAVSAAHALFSGQQACSTAAEVARRNRAELLGCEEEGGDVTVEVRVNGQRTTAKAGPI